MPNKVSKKDDVSKGQHQAALFYRIGDICTCVNTVMSKDELLKESLDKLMGLFQAERGSIFLLEENNKLRLASAVGLEAEDKTHLVKKMGEGVVGKVALNKNPMIVKDLLDDRRFKRSRVGDYRTNSFICAPLLVKDKLIGVISITDKISGNSFEEDEMQLLDFLAAQIALNYRRLTLYKKFKHFVHEAHLLRDKVGKSDQETESLRKQVYIQEKLATIGKLAGGIAHEFNNPLDGVIRYTNLCLEYVTDDVIRGYLLEIQQGLRRMEKIVKNLLSCSHDDFRTTHSFNLVNAVDQCLMNLRQTLEFKNIKVSKSVSRDIPELRDLGFERVISNLFNNAVDAIDGSGNIQIKARWRKHDLFFSIKDSGKGIGQKDLDMIFEPFFTTKDMDKGCGLGLTIVGEIVKSYEGKIDVKSEHNKGTEFVIQIPKENLRI